jgi:hypothetical protein
MITFAKLVRIVLGNYGITAKGRSLSKAQTLTTHISILKQTWSMSSGRSEYNIMAAKTRPFCTVLGTLITQTRFKLVDKRRCVTPDRILGLARLAS